MLPSWLCCGVLRTPEHLPGSPWVHPFLTWAAGWEDCLEQINGQFAPYPPYETWQDCFPEVLDRGMHDDLGDYDSEAPPEPSP